MPIRWYYNDGAASRTAAVPQLIIILQLVLQLALLRIQLSFPDTALRLDHATYAVARWATSTSTFIHSTFLLLSCFELVSI